MIFRKSSGVFGIILFLTIISPRPLNAAILAPAISPELGLQLTQIREILQNGMPNVLPSLPDLPIKITKRTTVSSGSGNLNKIIKAVSEEAGVLSEAMQGASIKAADGLENLKAKLQETGNSKSSSNNKNNSEVNQRSAPVSAPVTAPTNVPISSPTQTSAPTAAPTIGASIKSATTNILERTSSIAPSPNVSAAALLTNVPIATRLTGVEGQLMILRQLVDRQSDRNISSAAQFVRDATTVVTNIITSGFDTSTAHSWSILQEFTNASSTLFSANYASTTTLCVSGDCRTSWPSSSGSSFAYPFTKQADGYHATSTGILFSGGFVSTASTTIGAGTTATGLTINAGATSTGEFLHLGSTTLQVFAASAGTTTSATSTNLSTTNFLAIGSTTLQNFYATRGTTTSATSTNLYTTDLLSIGSTTFQRYFSSQGTTTSATSTNLYTTDFLSIGSTTFQKFFSSQGTTTSATSTNLYTTDFLSIGSTTFQKFFSSQGTTTSATSTNLYTTDFLSIGSSTFQKLFAQSATATNLFATNFLALGSSSFQKLFSSSATATSLYATNFLVDGSSTFQRYFSSQGTTTSATSTNLYTTDLLSIGSTTFQKFFSSQGTTTSATSTNLSTTNFLAIGSTTLQNFFATQGTTTSATSTNLYTTDFLSIGSSTFQKLFAQSATATNLFATNFLALGSSSFQKLFSSSATATSLYATNFLTDGSTTLQSATSTNFYASAGLNIGTAINFIGRSTTTITVNDTAWVVATNTAAAASPLLSFNNAFTNGAGTSTIQFFGATTTGLLAGGGIPLPSAVNQTVIIGDGKAQSGLSILKGGLCVDNDGWCTASTTGRISSVSSFIGASDLAEMYQASESVEAGDVVAIVSGISIAKATHGGKDKMMGVVSTNPGVVLGTGPDREGRAGDVPIALTGRVPVKVNTENGPIHAGDYLTLSTETGVAAKATKAGTTIGQALEDYSGNGVGKILVFVKNSYYSGLSLDSFPGLTVSNLSNAEAILIALQNGAQTHSAISSDLTADRMLAAVEIVTPKLTAGLISAQTIESPTITALSNRISTEASTLRSQIDAQNAAIVSLESRMTALENASSTSVFSLASVSDAVNGLFNSASEWMVGKITAALGVFNRIEVGTARVSQGIEMVDSQTGEIYCVTLKNNEWDKALGNCGSAQSTTVVTPEPDASSTESVEPPAPEAAPDQESTSATPNEPQAGESEPTL